ncbi:hypothetical protein HYH03_004370 [Edaphochlamys debaryana]|uniref:UspA domain-containing protein n=1 Tax=Edaphochlamys debaryana TaxID=47281 RepID=A0A835YF47_9CHLO|nr:hypothetical protein HYH03_004370 [Edaphochlamys debaryana]|eukprot:KAG2497630.1 hypothetical protein HYH03_004370 [Edaphochlamys debaryana]
MAPSRDVSPLHPDGNPVDTSMLESVEVEVKKRQGPFLHIACAVDGSLMSDKSMGSALSYFNSRRGDKFTVIHISDSSKSYLSKHLQPAHLKNYYVDMAHGARVKAEWLCREKEEGRSTCESLTRLADKAGTDLLVLGSWGRKGEKLDMLGTVSDFSLRQAHCSICIVRSAGAGSGLSGVAGGGGPSAAALASRPARFMFATDGSHAAHLAFCTLVNYLMRPIDSVAVIMVTTADGTEETKMVAQYAEFMKKRKIACPVHVKVVDRTSGSVPEGICSAVAEHGCDTLVMGISGYGRKKLGSVSEDISTRASCTTIIIKDSREVMSDRYTTAGIGTLAREVETAPIMQEREARQSSFRRATEQ